MGMPVAGNNPKMHDGDRFIFIGGSPRSGTTIVQNMLDSHPSIFGGPEFLHIPEIISLRDRLHRSVSLHYIDQFCSHDEVDAHIRALIESFLLPMVEQHGTWLFSEKTPANVLAFLGLAELWPRARFIHVVRDPRAIVSSMLEVGARAARQGFELQAFTRDIDAAISYVQKCFDAGFEAARREPKRVLTLVYEALVQEPERETRKLCAFLGIDWNAAMITPAAHKHAGERAITVHSHEVWYDVERYYSNPNTDSLDRWKTRLTPSQQTMVCKAFQSNEDLSRLGYDLSIYSLSTKKRLVGNATGAVAVGLNRLARITTYALKKAKTVVERIG
jgi:protein-tyrosine sulfotransferase